MSGCKQYFSFQTHINENFAKLSEALYKADRVARDAVEKRAQLEQRVAQKKKADEEEKMKQMAAKAREVSPKSIFLSSDCSHAFSHPALMFHIQERNNFQSRTRVDDNPADRQMRDEIRRDRLDDIRKERNIAKNKPDRGMKIRRSVLFCIL